MEDNGQDREKKDEYQFRGSEVLDRIKELIRQGNVRKLVLKKENGDVLLEIPVTAGVAVGGAITLIAPVLAAIGAAVAFLSKVKVEVHRVDDEE